MKKSTFYILIILALGASLAFGCKKKEKEHVPHDAKRFSNIEDLAEFFVMKIHEGDSRGIFMSMIDGKVYVDRYHPETPEAKAPSALPGDEFWRIFMLGDRIAGVRYHLRNYSGRVQAILGVGKPKTVLPIGPYFFLRRIPVTMEVMDDRGRVTVITDDNILGVVVKDGDDYMLLNVFK